MASALDIRDLWVAVDGRDILRGVNLKVALGEIHALMGPNGTGKSTLANALMGHPAYEITRGQILLQGEDLVSLGPDERAQRGLFLAFQYPVAIQGVSVANFLRMTINAQRKVRDPEDKGISIPEFRRFLKQKMDQLQFPHSLAGRYLNDGFSGGEKKRAEILQLATLEPKIAILDETDSGLDIDALRVVASSIQALAGPALGVLIITHYQRMLNYIRPDYVHVMLDGKVVASGQADLATRLEEHGYEWIRERQSIGQAEG